MSLPASDDFNRPDEHPIGGNWTAPDGLADSSFFLTSQSLQGQGGATLQWMYWNADAFSGNHKSSVTISGGIAITGGGTYAGVAVRVQAAGQSGYYWGIVAGAYRLRRLDAGTQVDLDGIADTPTVGDVLRLEVSGSTLTAYLNGVLKLTVVDATYTGGAAGLFGYSGVDNYELDSWTGDDVGSAPPPPPPSPGVMDGPFRAFQMRDRYPSSLRFHCTPNLSTTLYRNQDKQFRGPGQWQTYDYPLPKSRPYPQQLRTHAVSTRIQLLNLDRQFRGPGQWQTYDYPLPKVRPYPDGLRTQIGVFPARIDVPTPFLPVDASPAPRAARYPTNLRTFLVGGSLGSSETPFTVADWPVPTRRVYPIQLRSTVAFLVQDTTTQPPRVQTDWPAPQRREYPIELRFLRGRPSVVIDLSPLPPQVAGWDMPVPRRVEYPIQLRTATGLVTVAIPSVSLPPLNFDGPVPRLAARLRDLSTWLLSGPNLPMLVQEKPFMQSDWPLPRRVRYPDVLRSWISPTRVSITFLALWARNRNQYIGPSIKQMVKK